MVLAQANNTPVPFWLDLPLAELRAWILDSNDIQKSLMARISG